MRGSAFLGVESSVAWHWYDGCVDALCSMGLRDVTGRQWASEKRAWHSLPPAAARALGLGLQPSSLHGSIADVDASLLEPLWPSCHRHHWLPWLRPLRQARPHANASFVTCHVLFACTAGSVRGHVRHAVLLVPHGAGGHSGTAGERCGALVSVSLNRQGLYVCSTGSRRKL